jgi:hypothetical protein
LTALEAGLQQAAASGKLQLQSFSITSNTAGSQGILQHLPAAHLTHLEAAVDLASAASLQAVAALTGLQKLELACTSSTGANGGLSQLAGKLQQLTELHLTDVTPSQLLHLSNRVQQLHITAAVRSSEQLAWLADWLSQETGALRSLAVSTPNSFGAVPAAWVATRNSVVTALQDASEQQTAGSAHTANGTAAAGTAAAAAGPLRNLQSLSWVTSYLGSAGAVLNYVPASSLTELACCLDWRSSADIAVLCNLTGLCSLALKALDGPGHMQQSDQAAGNMVAQLSALQQLTHIQIASPIHRPQLQHLPQLPQLQLLRANIYDTGPKKDSRYALKLGHLTAVRTLILSGTARSERVLRPDDTLPPNLQRLRLTGSVGNSWQVRDTSCSWEPLHSLSKLKHLEANFWPGEPKETGKLSKLAILTSLSSVE